MSAVRRARRRQRKLSAQRPKTLSFLLPSSSREQIRSTRHGAAIKLNPRGDRGAAHMRMLRAAHLYRTVSGSPRAHTALALLLWTGVTVFIFGVLVDFFR